MKKLTILYLTAALVIISTAAKAQYYQDVQGRAIKEYKADDADGFPYLFNTWMVGSATVEKGVYKDMKLKYDLKNDEVIFAAKDDVPMNFADPVKSFTINNRVFANGFPTIGPQLKSAYYEVLSDGKIKLLKHYAKHIQETKSYGTTAVTREYVANETYYVFKDAKIASIKADKKAVLAVMDDKAAQVDEYLKTNKVNFKNDADLGKLFNYYNGL